MYYTVDGFQVQLIINTIDESDFTNPEENNITLTLSLISSGGITAIERDITYNISTVEDTACKEDSYVNPALHITYQREKEKGGGKGGRGEGGRGGRPTIAHYNSYR